jgi:hypothetical protein
VRIGAPVTFGPDTLPEEIARSLETKVLGL